MNAKTKTLLAALGMAVVVLGLAFYVPKALNRTSGLTTSAAGTRLGSTFQQEHAAQVQGIKVLRCLKGKQSVYLCAAVVSVSGKIVCITILGKVTRDLTTIGSVSVRQDVTCYFAT